MPHFLLATGLLFFLLIVMPVWGWFDMRRLKRLDTPAARNLSYTSSILTMWVLTLFSLLLPASVLWSSPAGLAAGLELERIPPAVLPALLTALAVGLLAPVLIARRKPDLIERQLAPIRALLPTGSGQRWLFALVCLTAGICEEWIYRGFVLHYLIAVWPGMNAWIVLAVSAVLFGMAHAYQGLSGTLATTFLGVIFAVLYLATGNLLLPMALHVLIDLRILLLLPREPATA